MKQILHIGGNKTASTTLQRCLFSKSNELIYLGEDCNQFSNYQPFLHSLVSDDDIHYQHVKNTIGKLFQSHTESTDNKTFLYSNEDIMTSRLPTVCAKRLHSLMPSAEVLIVIRNQMTAVPSIYANHGAYLKGVPRCYWKRHVSFDDWIQYSIDFINYSYLDSFFYYQIASLYASLFGKEKIHILLFEDFIHNKSKFIRDLSSILNIDINTSTHLLSGKHERPRNTQRQFYYHRLRNKFFWNKSLSKCFPFGKTIGTYWHDYLSKGKPLANIMPEEWAKKVADLYRSDNTNMAREFNLPLQKYGYPVE
jgi:hypothetical protein